MAKPLQLSRVPLLFRRGTLLTSTATQPRCLFLPSKLHKPISPKPLLTQPFSTNSTPYPLQYEMIISRPAQSSTPPRRRTIPKSESSGSISPRDPDLSFEDWVDKKLTSSSQAELNQPSSVSPSSNDSSDSLNGMDKSKRKYYNKRRRRILGSDSEDEINRGRDDNGVVELKQEVVELRTLHKREEELYFYDAFAYPWEKDKHYKMVYQLEKKYFPDQGFDKAFLEPGKENADEKKLRKRVKTSEERIVESSASKGLVFFEERVGERKDDEESNIKDVKIDVSEKKVEEFFKRLDKIPNKDQKVAQAEPFFSSRSTGLPAKWDSVGGTVLLVNKPKGWTSFTVCGKLRRLVKVKKVGHAGTLDPMATGLLILCVGKATKLVDRYQGMIKGYSGIFRLGEATSTWDADSPVIQREPWEHIKDDDLKKAAGSFSGEIWQVPPMFSAIKVGGEKMYEKARRGESIELSPRRISIFQFDVERSLDDRQNVIFRVICSKGTYVRSLCADFGKALGSCAHLTALRRDSIGEYLADDAWDFKELEDAINKGYM